MTEPSPTLSPLGRIVQRHDPDRFLTALFAPPARRETLFLLYAVNHELARAREVVSNPMLALIRLQWWREVAEGARRRHEVAGPLGDALDDGRLLPADILAMIEGREAEAGPIEDATAFRAYVRAAFGGVALAAARALGAGGAALETVRDLGAAYGVAGILRNVPVLARHDRCVLPLDLLRAANVSEGELGSQALPAGFAQVQATLAGIGWDWLAEGSRTRLPRAVIAAALPGVLARHDLRHPGRTRRRGVAVRIAVAVAAASRRI